MVLSRGVVLFGGGGHNWGGAVQGDAVWGGRCCRGMLSRRGGAVQAGVVLSITGSDIITAPPVNRMTDKCKNITLPQTSFVAVTRKGLLCGII